MFSIFPDTILETRYSQKLRYHHIAVLYGEDPSGEVTLLFGIVIFRRSNRLAYLYTLEKLFSFLGGQPKVLVTDYEPALSEAVQRFQKRSDSKGIQLHLQLPDTFIANSFQSRANPQFISALSTAIDGILLETDRKKYDQRIDEVREACRLVSESIRQQTESLVLGYIRSNSIIHMPPYFIGLTLTPYSVASALRLKMHDYFKAPRPMVLAVKAFF